jgi:membrane-associated phospholipid phosphatase
MPLSYPLFTALYILSMVVGLFIGLLIFVGWKALFLEKLLRSLKSNAGYILVLAILPLITLIENLLRDPAEATKEITYTNWIFTLGGDAVRILQDRLDYQILVDTSIVIYVWLFTFILYFTPLLLLAVDDWSTLRRYSLAMIFNYTILLPFYLFFPVTVTGFHPDSGLTPLLYINTNWGRMVTSVDPLNNDFPSGHISIILTTLLVLISAGYSRRGYTYFVAFALAGIAFAVLYLGVHWIADIIAGVALAIGTTLLSRNKRLQAFAERHLGKVSSRLFKEEHGEHTTSHLK